MFKLPEISKIITRKYILKLPFIMLAMLIGSMFEVVGLGLVILMMNVITNPSEGKYISLLYLYYPGLSSESVIYLTLALFAAFHVLKGIYLVFLARISGRFSYDIKANINNQLMHKYIKGPYDFHLNNNSSQLIRNITTETDQLVKKTLQPIITLSTEVIVIVSIVTFLMLIEPLGTLMVVSLLFVFSLVFQKLIKNIIADLGKTRQYADGLIVQVTQEAIGGIKDVKILSREDAFLEQFSKYNKLSSVASSKEFMWSQIPGMYLETVFVLALSVLLLFTTISVQSPLDAIPTLSVFAIAAFRLLPSASRILSSLNSLRFSSSVVISLAEQLNAVSQLPIQAKNENATSHPASFSKNIEIQHLSYQYPNSESRSLRDISLSIRKGESIGIIGKSGSGKSTLLDIILGLLVPTSGSILVDGTNIYDNLKDWQQKIGYVQQDVFLVDESIRKNIAFGLLEGEIDDERMLQVVIEAQLDELVASLPGGLNTQLGERGVRLSGGQKQRIGIARALYRKSSILILDEATSALDSATECEIVSIINNFKGNKTIIVIAHRHSTLEHCDRIIELNNGSVCKIFEGTEMKKLFK